MPYVPVPAPNGADPLGAAEDRWAAVTRARPDLEPAVTLQRRLLTIVVAIADELQRSPLPRLSLPPKYLAAKLARGVPILAGEPIPVPTRPLAAATARLCEELADGGAGAAADHIREAIASGGIDAASLFTASLARDQQAIRMGATHRGISPDLLWLVGELAVSPFAWILQNALLSAPPVTEAMDRWGHGYCPACGSWPAVAEVVGGHRTLRCSLCSGAWELNSYACIYCGNDDESFVTAAPDVERKDRRVEACRRCGSYLKTIDLSELSPFPLLALSDLETMDLDVAAMEHNYTRPPLRSFARPRA
jgi:FdhE protein